MGKGDAELEAYRIYKNRELRLQNTRAGGCKHSNDVAVVERKVEEAGVGNGGDEEEGGEEE